MCWAGSPPMSVDHPDQFRPLRSLIAALLAFHVLGFSVVGGHEGLHELIHQKVGEDCEDHVCAITLFADGQVECETGFLTVPQSSLCREEFAQRISEHLTTREIIGVAEARAPPFRS